MSLTFWDLNCVVIKGADENYLACDDMMYCIYQAQRCTSLKTEGKIFFHPAQQYSANKLSVIWQPLFLFLPFFLHCGSVGHMWGNRAFVEYSSYTGSFFITVLTLQLPKVIRTEFLHRIQSNINQISDENKEKYQFGNN